MKDLLRALGRAWRAVAHGLGRVQTYLLLTVIYFLAIGLVGPLVRLFSGDPLDRRLDHRPSNWHPKPPTNLVIDEARRIF